MNFGLLSLFLVMGFASSAAPAEGAEVPGLLRRPLVEVQRTVPAAADRRERLRQPDVIALWAVGLAVVVLLAAILTANSAA